MESPLTERYVVIEVVFEEDAAPHHVVAQLLETLHLAAGQYDLLESTAIGAAGRSAVLYVAVPFVVAIAANLATPHVQSILKNFMDANADVSSCEIHEKSAAEFSELKAQISGADNADLP